MQPKTQKLLEDIHDAASFILQRTQDLTVHEYQDDRLLRQAVERNFEIIGEAVNRIRKTDPDVCSKIADTDHIIAFRNILIHGYQLIDDTEVWRVITNSLPTLVQQVERLLAH